MNIIQGLKNRFRKMSNRLSDSLNGIPPASGDGITREMVKTFVNKDNPVILEIGCNDGSNTLDFLEDFKNAEIHCFEPDPRAIKRFKGKVGIDARVELHQMALSGKNGIVKFHQSDGQRKDSRDPNESWDLAGSILEPYKHKEVHEWCKFESIIEVESMRLDTFIENLDVSVIDFVWMDVQGAEYDVLKGAENTLGKIRYLYTEYSDTELYHGQKDLLTLAKLLEGFKIEHRFSDDVLFSNKTMEMNK